MLTVVAIVALLSAALTLFLTYQIAYETGKEGRSVPDCVGTIIHLLMCAGCLVAIGVLVLLKEYPC